jgi:hypothetical protein
MTDRESREGKSRRADDGDPAQSGKIRNGKRIHTPSAKENAEEKQEDRVDQREDLSKARGDRFDKAH